VIGAHLRQRNRDLAMRILEPARVVRSARRLEALRQVTLNAQRR
jgi:hypothetical protein